MNADGEALVVEGGERRAVGRMEELIEAHSDDAVRLAFLLTGDKHLARDLAQDAFVRLFARFRDRSAPANFHGYLRSTLVNLTRDHWRRRRTASSFDARQRRRDAAISEMPSVEERDELWQALQQLPARQRAALVFRYYEDLSEAQVAEILGCSVGAVKGLVTRGSEAMRKYLGEER